MSETRAGPLRVVFSGSPSAAIPTLEALASDARFALAGAVTQPPRPRGRGRVRTPSPVQVVAEQRGIPVLTPERVNTPESLAALRALQPDLLVVVAYGQILSPELLSLPRRGCVNLHMSLLPAYRGAAPVQWAVARGDAETGVTVMMMNERMDAGDILAQRTTAIGPEETAGDVQQRLAALGADLMVATLPGVADGSARREVQDESRATYAPRIKKADGRIDWTAPARELYHRVRGFNPWPVCFCRCPAAPGTRGGGGGALRVYRARAEAGQGAPGEVLAVDGDGPLVATGGGGALRLLEVQPEGRNVMRAEAYMAGRRLRAGERFD